MRPQHNESARKLTVVLFTIYLIVLTWIILLKMSFNLAMFDMNYRNINLVPFAGSLLVNGRIGISEIIMNIIVFIPFGVYMSMLFREWNLVKKAAPAFIVSLLYEILQYIFGIGASDITDLLGNTLGAIIGIGIYSIFWRGLGERATRLLNIIALVGTVVAIMFLGFIVIANM